MNFDYIKSWDYSDYENIIFALHSINKDIENLNNDNNLNIYLTDYYEQKIKKYISENIDIFKLKLYNSLIDNIAKQELFLDKVYKFVNYRIDNIVNSVNFSWKQIILKNFPELLIKDNENNQFDHIYNSNIKELFHGDHDDYLSNKPKLSSQLYFILNNEQKQSIKIEYKNWKKEKDIKNNENAKKQDNNSFPNIETTIDDLREIPNNNGKPAKRRRSEEYYNRENANKKKLEKKQNVLLLMN